MNKFLLSVFFVISFSFLSAQEDGSSYCAEGKQRAFTHISKLSKTAYPGDSNIDVTYYKLNLTVGINPSSLSGIVNVNAKAKYNGLSSIFLDLKNTLAVKSVTSNGTSVKFSQTTDHKLNITLDRLYAYDEEIKLEITYSGVPVAGGGMISSGSFLFYDTNAKKDVIASLSEPYGARDWWPSKDTPDDKADSSDVWITCSGLFVGVSNGKLVETVTNESGSKTYKWHNSYPIANYLISIAVTNYQTINDQYEYQPGKFLPVVHYVYPETNTTTRKTAVAKTINMLKIFSEKFGEYPFLKEKYAHAEFAWGGGMEHQTATSMGTGAMNSENTIAHELAHQWFGDKVTCKNWQNIWINEGFASYSECIYREAAYGAADFNSYVNNFMNSTVNGAKKAVGSIYVQNILSENEIFNSARSYKKGAMVLHMLRGIVGDAKFFQILKEYLVEPGLSYNVATTEDFQRICERVYGQSLDYFFKQWIYGENYPKYTVGTSWNSTSGLNFVVNFRLKQQTNSNPIFFKMPVQLRITTSMNTYNFTLLNDQQDQGWSFPVSGQPTKIEFDPDNWILKDIVGTTSVDDFSEKPTEFSLSQNYPNPFNPETIIKYTIPVVDAKFASTTHVTLKVYDVIGNEVATLVNEVKQPGAYNYKLSIINSSPRSTRVGAGNLPSGVYFYRLTAGKFSETKKMLLLK